MIRVAFLGTPQAAVPTLEAVSERFEVGLVITQPDKARGRSGTPRPGPVKAAAFQHGIPVAQPATHDELKEALVDSGPFAVGVVVAYGRIIHSESLELPGAGMLNVHFSLLPRWRGAAPVNRALIEGDTMTGVTIIKLDEGLDTGPVLTAQAVDIGEVEDAGALTDRLARLGARLLVDNLGRYLDGDMMPVPQSGDGASYAPKLTKADRELSVENDPVSFVNRVRGVSPEPAAVVPIDDEVHKIYAAEPAEAYLAAGTWKAVDGWPVIGLSRGAVRVLSIQAPGKQRISGDSWVRGRRNDTGRVG
ncbi:MAG: methionyl-tRNA formyltransferase [Acidimicrobiia bacterium]